MSDDDDQSVQGAPSAQEEVVIPLTVIHIPCTKDGFDAERIRLGIRVQDFLDVIKAQNEHLRRKNAGIPQTKFTEYVDPTVVEHLKRWADWRAFLHVTHFQRVTSKHGKLSSKNSIQMLTGLRIEKVNGEDHVVVENYMYYSGEDPMEQNEGVHIFQPVYTMPFSNDFGFARLIAFMADRIRKELPCEKYLWEQFNRFLRLTGKGARIEPWGYFVTKTTLGSKEAPTNVYIPFGKNGFVTDSFIEGAYSSLIKAGVITADQQVAMAEVTTEEVRNFNGFKNPAKPITPAKPPPEPRNGRRRGRRGADGPEEGAPPMVYHGRDAIDYPDVEAYLVQLLRRDRPDGSVPDAKVPLREIPNPMKGFLKKFYDDIKKDIPGIDGLSEEEQVKRYKDKVLDGMCAHIAANFSHVFTYPYEIGIMLRPIDGLEVVWKPPTIRITDTGRKACVHWLLLLNQLAESHAHECIFLGHLIFDSNIAMLLQQLLQKCRGNAEVCTSIFRGLEIFDKQDKTNFMKDGDVDELLFSLLHFYLQALVDNAKEAWVKMALRHKAKIGSGLAKIANKANIAGIPIELTPECATIRQQLADSVRGNEYRLSYLPAGTVKMGKEYGIQLTEEDGKWAVGVVEFLVPAFNAVFNHDDPRPPITSFPSGKNKYSRYADTAQFLYFLLGKSLRLEASLLKLWKHDIAPHLYRNLVLGDALTFCDLDDEVRTVLEEQPVTADDFVKYDRANPTALLDKIKGVVAEVGKCASIKEAIPNFTSDFLRGVVFFSLIPLFKTKKIDGKKMRTLERIAPCVLNHEGVAQRNPRFFDIGVEFEDMERRGIELPCDPSDLFNPLVRLPAPAGAARAAAGDASGAAAGDASGAAPGGASRAAPGGASRAAAGDASGAAPGGASRAAAGDASGAAAGGAKRRRCA